MFLNNNVTHTEFLSQYREGRVTVTFDPPAAASLLSAKLALPLVMLPVLGLGVGLALMGWIGTGLCVIALGIIVPRLIKRSAPHFLLSQVLQDSSLYDEVCKSGVMHIANATTGTACHGAPQ